MKCTYCGKVATHNHIQTHQAKGIKFQSVNRVCDNHAELLPQAETENSIRPI